MRSETLEIIAEFQIDDATTAASFGLRVRAEGGEATVVGYHMQQQQLFVDRAKSGLVDFNAHFAGIYRAPLAPVAATLRLHIFVDTSSVEVFGNNGLAAITALIFPEAGSTGLELFTEQGQVVLNSLDVYDLSHA